MIHKRTGTCTVLDFYDLDGDFCRDPENMKNLFYYLEKWCLDQGWPPIRMGLSGNQVAPSTKTRTFKYCKKLLEKLEFKNIDHFWLGATPPAHPIDTSEARLSVALSLTPTSRHKTFTLYFHHDVIPHSWDEVEKLVQDLSRWVRSGYGISYQWDFNKGPGFYPYGVIGWTSRNDDDPAIKHERKKMTCWLHKYGDPEYYRHGMVREIYPLNFLSAEHLAFDIQGKSLREWIDSSPDHGTLKPLTDLLWSWRVPEDKVPLIQDALKDTGLILCV